MEFGMTHVKAFEELYEEYFPKIYNYIFYRILRREDTEDLVSETFMKAAKNMHRFDDKKASFKTWIFHIAKNTLTDFYRKQKKEASLDDENARVEIAVDFDVQFDRIALPKRRALLRELMGLKEKERMILYYRYFEGYKNREIAKRLGMNESTVGTVLGRTLKKLRTEEIRDLMD